MGLETEPAQALVLLPTAQLRGVGVGVGTEGGTEGGTERGMEGHGGGAQRRRCQDHHQHQHHETGFSVPDTSTTTKSGAEQLDVTVSTR